MNKLLIVIGVAVLLFCGVGNANATLTPVVDINDLVAGAPTLLEGTETFFPLPEISFEPAELIPLPEPSFIPFVPKLQTYYTISSSFTMWSYSYIPPTPTTYTVYEVDETPVPEPATMLLFGTGLAGLVGYRLRKKQKSLFQR